MYINYVAFFNQILPCRFWLSIYMHLIVLFIYYLFTTKLFDIAWKLSIFIFLIHDDISWSFYD